MRRFVRLAGISIVALALMAAFGAMALTLAKTNSSISAGWFFATAGVLYTIALMFVLSRFDRG